MGLITVRLCSFGDASVVSIESPDMSNNEYSDVRYSNLMTLLLLLTKPGKTHYAGRSLALLVYSHYNSYMG